MLVQKLIISSNYNYVKLLTSICLLSCVTSYLDSNRTLYDFYTEFKQKAK